MTCFSFPSYLCRTDREGNFKYPLLSPSPFSLFDPTGRSEGNHTKACPGSFGFSEHRPVPKRKSVCDLVFSSKRNAFISCSLQRVSKFPLYFSANRGGWIKLNLNSSKVGTFQSLNSWVEQFSTEMCLVFCWNCLLVRWKTEDIVLLR